MVAHHALNLPLSGNFARVRCQVPCWRSGVSVGRVEDLFNGTLEVLLQVEGLLCRGWQCQQWLLDHDLLAMFHHVINLALPGMVIMGDTATEASGFPFQRLVVCRLHMQQWAWLSVQ